jgi:hypothetical protein
MLADSKLIAFRIVSKIKVRIAIRPLWRRIVDIAAKRSRRSSALFNLLHWIVQSDCAPNTSLRWLLDSDAIGYVLRNLMNDKFEATTVQN